MLSNIYTYLDRADETKRDECDLLWLKRALRELVSN